MIRMIEKMECPNCKKECLKSDYYIESYGSGCEIRQNIYHCKTCNIKFDILKNIYDVNFNFN